ncbi:copper homeostasis protein CutC [Tundrisphaera sp. TA3]|uniref:copper homeostasis protein CutC n=1 Tax=Tundrisphaera sp. TA3 TaxID=3435775 RepID=UPI003EBB1578
MSDHASKGAGIVVEACAEGIASALAAGAGGADRVELCENLAVGGVTPGVGAIAVACERLAIPVQVLIRPRGGDFHHGPDEVEAMRHDIRAARERGAAGVVLGVLDARGEIDRDAVGRLAELARPMSVTFHKAFDLLVDPIAGLDTLIGLGIDRVLTSGAAPTARLGMATLADLVRHASGRIAILAGGRVAEPDLVPLVASGLTEVHAGSALARDGAIDADLVRSFIAAARGAFAAPRHNTDGPIWHLAPREDWKRAVDLGVPYAPGSLAAEGFIHASVAGELAESANRYYRGRTDLLALQIDPARVCVPIVWEYAAPRRAWFPHLYGPLDPSAVVSVTPLPPGADGRFAWP